MSFSEAVPLSEHKKSKQSKSSDFNIVCLDKIMATEYPPIHWAVKGYLPEGLSILAGRQKLGKTWLALDWAVAIATGCVAMGKIECEPGNVLYLDLENGHRRIKRRIETMFPNEKIRPSLTNIDIVTEAPQLDKGLIACLDKWKRETANPKLIVIDVLQRVKPAGNGNRNAYENDYAIFQDLQSWATNSGLAVLALHHTRKGGADDPLEALSGSNGLSACADTTLLLDRDSNGMTLYVRGRDVEEVETAVRFDSGLWTILGDAASVYRSDERNQILSALLTADMPMTPIELVAATGMRRNNIDQLLYKAAKDGEVIKAGRGLYIHSTRSDLLPPLKLPIRNIRK
jgi:hypothetical protein